MRDFIRRTGGLLLALLGLALELLLVLPALLAVLLPGTRLPFAPAPPVVAILAHLAAALLAGLAFQGFPLLTWRRRADDPALAALAAVLALFLPVAGGAWAVVMSLVRAPVEIAGERARRYRGLVDVPLPLEEQPRDARPEFVDRARRALEVRAFSDFVSHQSEPAVVDVAFRSARLLKRPVLYRVLKRTLRSRSPEIRAYAAAALSRMEDELDRELHDADRALAARPGDPLAQERLAEARLAYLDVGDLGDPVRAFHLSEAIRLFEACLAAAPPEHRARLEERLARALLARGEPARAAVLYRRLVDREAPDVDTVEQAMRACLAAGDLSALAAVLDLARRRRPDVPLIAHHHRIWMGV